MEKEDLMANMQSDKEKARMRNATLVLVTIALLATVDGFLMLTSPARADSWTVCNRSPEELNAVIAYSDGRQYISKGWWRLGACGGCKTVLSGNIPIKGVFLRAEGASSTVEGTELFCAKRTAFEMPNANADDRACRARGGEQMAFSLHKLTSGRFTTTLHGAPNSRTHCID
jgi:uncharacterized membrane protein